jgi:hypothetical protein
MYSSLIYDEFQKYESKLYFFLISKKKIIPCFKGAGGFVLTKR